MKAFQRGNNDHKGGSQTSRGESERSFARRHIRSCGGTVPGRSYLGLWVLKSVQPVFFSQPAGNLIILRTAITRLCLETTGGGLEILLKSRSVFLDFFYEMTERNNEEFKKKTVPTKN